MFEATAMLLETVWFAKEAINYEKCTIDWGKIDEAKNQIMPSTSEQLKLDLAQQFWRGSGVFVDYFVQLDHQNKDLLIEACKKIL